MDETWSESHTWKAKLKSRVIFVIQPSQPPFPLIPKYPKFQLYQFWSNFGCNLVPATLALNSGRNSRLQFLPTTPARNSRQQLPPAPPGRNRGEREKIPLPIPIFRFFSLQKPCLYERKGLDLPKFRRLLLF